MRDGKALRTGAICFSLRPFSGRKEKFGGKGGCDAFGLALGRVFKASYSRHLKQSGISGGYCVGGLFESRIVPHRKDRPLVFSVRPRMLAMTAFNCAFVTAKTACYSLLGKYHPLVKLPGKKNTYLALVAFNCAFVTAKTTR